MDGDKLGRLLLRIARSAIAGRFGAAPVVIPDLRELREPGATFVTLMAKDALRGCIGSLAARRPLIEDVQENACGAAFRDPRFPPLTEREWPGVRVEVSLLTPPEPIEFRSEGEALASLRPGVDGVVLSADGRRSTFLPQVWAQLPEPADFLGQLKAKAGLPADYWGDDIRLERYQAMKWKE